MIEQWFRCRCPKCENLNWINNGDPADMTIPDVEGINCWNCQHSWKISEFEEEEDEDEEDVYYVDGLHFEEIK
jgi:hypothetical protein